MKRLILLSIHLVALSVIVYLGWDLYSYITLRQEGTSEIEDETIKPSTMTRPRQDSPRSAIMTIMGRNLFGSRKADGGAMKRKQIEKLPPTSLKIALKGTVTGSEKNACAVILDQARNRQGLFRVGDSIENAVVQEILSGRVVLRVGGKHEILIMEVKSSKIEKKRPRKAKKRIRRKREG